MAWISGAVNPFVRRFLAQLGRIAMQHTRRLAKVETRFVVLGAVLLIGVLLLAFGHYQHSTLSLVSGLFVIGAGVLNGVIRIVGH